MWRCTSKPNLVMIHCLFPSIFRKRLFTFFKCTSKRPEEIILAHVQLKKLNKSVITGHGHNKLKKRKNWVCILVCSCEFQKHQRFVWITAKINKFVQDLSPKSNNSSGFLDTDNLPYSHVNCQATATISRNNLLSNLQRDICMVARMHRMGVRIGGISDKSISGSCHDEAL